MKIDNAQMVISGFLILLLSAVLSFFENKTPITENDMLGLVGFFFLIWGSCIRKE